jgi:16S rRNA (guanine(527)-N(7))-methyltransferase RsmG
VPAPDRTPDWFTGLLEKELRPWLVLSSSQIHSLWEHYEILLRWNNRINLTSIPAGEEMVIRHYCESLFLGAHMPITSDGASVLDLGSGAGFPGVPLAIQHPTWRITLLESNQRKAVFLKESTRLLPNISVLARRAESASGGFDWLVSRGVDARDVLKNVPVLARSVGLMLSQDDFLAVQHFPAIAWSEPVRLPWGDRRLCVFGVHVDDNISHGT